MKTVRPRIRPPEYRPQYKTSPLYAMFHSMTGENYERSIDALRAAILGACDANGMSKSELARAIGLDRITLHNYLSARRDPKLIPLLACADHLKLQISRGEDGVATIKIPRLTRSPDTITMKRHHIIDELDSFITNHDLTEADISARARISYARLKRVMAGTVSPTIDELESIFALLGGKIYIAWTK